MSYQPLISKIRCHNPNKSSSKHANRANVRYVATREGVDLSPIDNESNIHQHASNEEYVTYIAKRPRSHGLFGNIDTSDLKEIEQQIYQVSKSGQNIYRGIISLGEQDAQALDFTTSNAWYQQMKSIIPELAKELGVNPIDFTWVGAFHAEPTHPHVHYLLWDNADRVHSSFIHPSVQKRCRNLLEKSFFTEEYEKSLQAVFEAEREELYAAKNSSRQSITDFFKEVMSIQYVPGTIDTRLPPKFTHTEALHLSQMIEHLQSVLPNTGRMNYQFMPKEIKKELDQISSSLFKRPELKSALSKYMEAADQIHQIQYPGQSDVSRKLAKKDIYRRTGNIILKYASPSGTRKTLLSENQEPDSIAETDFPDSDFSAPLSDIDIEPEIEESPEYQDAEKDLDLSHTPVTQELLPEPEASSSDLPEYHPTDGTLLSLAEAYLSDSCQNLDAAFPILSELAEKNNAKAQYLLGRLFLDHSEYDNYEKGMELLQLSASQEYESAQYDLHYLQQSGELPVYQNPADLGTLYVKWNSPYKEAASALYNEEDFSKAHLLLLKQANAGNVLAYLDLAKIYERGLGIEANKAISEEYYRCAFLGFTELEKEESSDYLEYRLGKLCESGKGTLKNFQKAAFFYSSSACNENQFAQYSLGKLYLLHPEEFEQEPKELLETAKNLFQLSAEQGFPYAAYEYANLNTEEPSISAPYYQQAHEGFQELLSKREDDMLLYRLGKMSMEGKGTEQNMEQAVTYWQRAAELKNVHAQLKLAQMYLSDEYPDYQDMEAGLSLLSKLSEQNNETAQYTLGKFLLSDQYPEHQDIPKALKLLQASADQGNQYAQYALGKFLLSDQYLGYQDIPKALKLLWASAEQGNSHAQYTLGTIYLYGKYSVEKDVELGKKLLQASADQKNEHAQNILSHYELLHSAPYIIANLIYKAFFYSMMQDQCRKQQELTDKKRAISKQAQKEQHKQEEITHL